MSTWFAGLRPEPLWRHFDAVCRHPHPSGHEAPLRAHIVDWARSHGLAARVDDAGNAIVRKPASGGQTAVVLQAHLDMVPQQAPGIGHDFTRDPIRPEVDGEWVRARGTTLGADNGIGLAAALAVLEASGLRHGPLECLFTADEEQGMTGVFGLTADALTGRVLLNLDSEDEGEFTVGCAGGEETEAALPLPVQPPPGDQAWFRLVVGGLRGGHSGTDIALERGNAVKLITRLLRRLTDHFPVHLARMAGGDLPNAIPRDAETLFGVPLGQAADLERAVDAAAAGLRQELGPADPGLRVGLAAAEAPDRVLTPDGRDRLLLALTACPHGVLAMNQAVPGLVETSTNLARVSLADGRLAVGTSQRGMTDSRLDEAAAQVAAGWALAGAEVNRHGRYPGWRPNPGSRLLEVMQATHQELYGQPARVAAIHAGLECGTLAGVWPDMDMVSFGPTIQGPHSPDERVHIESVGRFWDLLVAVLGRMP